ncbi:molybdate ABC transporter ATP-binding protein ModF [Chromatiaceae bacterium AAb-1]|nr:molybdate ABC transporter ATP-binding protein ModF [Chromatiaceae bacterium AAb-1]
MKQLSLQQLTVRFKNGFTLSDINWQLQTGQHWAVTGANGAGKSALTALLADFSAETQGITVLGGTKHADFQNVALVSSAQQQQWLEQERLMFDRGQLDDSNQGTTVAALLQQQCADTVLLHTLIQQFDMERLLQRPFRLLSTGELRKLALIAALSRQPELLVLDEPFAGLDQASVLALKSFLQQWQQQCLMVFVIGRTEDIPDFVSHLAYMAEGCLALTSACSSQHLAELRQLMQLQLGGLQLPEPEQPESEQKTPPLAAGQPLVRLQNIRIVYNEQPLFKPLNWTIMPGQHWQLCGPNGCGKSSLLALITGDHPQCYSNDIFVFGFQRGNGESIWQIKQYIGYVSSALQQDYRIRSNIRDTLLSGFYDSIGLYQKATARQQHIAEQWLDILGLRQRQYQSFTDLSFGDQRLVLIARAMIKRPALLILDEPCLGLDELNRHKVLALTELICQQGSSTVLYVNHHAADKIAGISHYLDLAEYRF